MGGLALLVGDQTAVLIRFQTGGGHAEQRVGAGAESVDHGVHFEHEVGALDRHRTAAALLVRLAELHLDALDAGHVALLVADDAHRVGEQLELDLFLLGVVDLFLTGGDLFHAAAVDDVDVLRAETLRAAGGVHGDVAGADDGDALVVLDRRVVIFAVSLHEVDTGQELVGGVNAEQVLARNAEEAGQTRAGAEEHGLKAFLGEQLVDGDRAADDGVGHDLNAHLFERGDFARHDRLGQTELGDAVHQNAAGLVEQLVHGDFIAHAGEVARAGQTGRAGADDGDAVAVGNGLLDLRVGVGVGGVPVGDEALETADADALALDAADALALALMLLRADAAADGGQAVGGGDDLVGFFKLALGDLGDELGNADVHRAAADAGMLTAVEAALGLVDGDLLGVAESDLVKVLVAYQRLLLRNGVFRHTHISHVLHLR